ncbi:LOW QUALITY PROTEIN: Hypothetical protein PHPALM_1675 [Phytophthora palmivora]|uniref:Uncharacterized protein n=1 Tax=Phytophthora palmivora TaxID=4796 RepID=A0A2P4YRR1_9STRA|nr:LOW QUALITY PROTEIN: Hypothetical protein PHPALM_1675 [Phytophthora palmivora]
MRRAPRGLDAPVGTVGQELAAVKIFTEFLLSVGLSSESIDKMHSSLSTASNLPLQNFYSLLTAFSIFLQTKKSNKARAVDGFLSKSTALSYFSQIVNLLRERYSNALSDSKRVAKIREKMASAIEERNLRANAQTNDAPGCTIKDLCVLVEYLALQADIATCVKSVHDAALLIMMWHTFGRAIDTCFARKQQLSVAASGELFLHIARIKTSVVQGVSIYKSGSSACYAHLEFSSCAMMNLQSTCSRWYCGSQTYTQEEAVIYWESLQANTDNEHKPAEKRQRKRPNVASYITEVIRDSLKEIPPTMQQTVASNMTSHSLCRGAAAYANACPKLAIQWISTRGAWLLESLTKAFAYIGTTTLEDQSVGKRLSVAEFGQLITLRDELFQHVLGSPDTKYNVPLDVVNTIYAALLMHMKVVLECTPSSSTQLTLYEYSLHRAVAATHARLGCHISTATCCDWGELLTAHWRSAYHAQVSTAVAGGDSLLASTMESILKQLVQINDRLARVESTLPTSDSATSDLRHAEFEATGIELPSVNLPAPATASTLAGCVWNWYTNKIWETVKDKKGQNNRADAKAAVNIMLILYQSPCAINQPPSTSNASEYQAWKHTLWDLAQSLERTANERLHALDGKKSTTKASSLRKRW